MTPIEDSRHPGSIIEVSQHGATALFSEHYLALLLRPWSYAGSMLLACKQERGHCRYRQKPNSYEKFPGATMKCWRFAVPSQGGQRVWSLDLLGSICN